MRRNAVANTYARALLEVGRERGENETYAEELSVLAEEILSDRTTRVFLESPKIPRPEKKEVLRKALRGNVSEPVLNLLFVLIDRGRQFVFGEIVEAFVEFNDEVVGRQHVRLTSAMPLPDESRNRLLALLGQKLDVEIIPHERVDDDLVGGMTIRVGDTVIDGSLRSRLNEVRELVAAQRLGSELFHED